MSTRAPRRPERPFCEAKTRKQMEATGWGDSLIGCGRRGVVEVEGHWACHQHADENKRYGWNPRSRTTT